MNKLEMCRICAETSNELLVDNIFERQHKHLIQQIKEITGFTLRNIKGLPEHMCKQCKLQLEQAYVFRKRCIAAQNVFKYTSSKTEPKNGRSKKRYETTKDIDIKREQQEENEEIKQDNLTIFLKEEPEISEESCRIYEEGVAHIPEESTGSSDKGDVNNHNGSHDPIDSNDGCAQNETKKMKNKMKDRMKDKFKKPRISRKQLNPKISKSSKKTSAKQHSLICDQCGNHFTCPQHFRTHLMRHSGDKPFQCEICPNKFTTSSELKRHMRRHTGERPFECKHCGRRFSDYSTRIKHERIHTNERPFPCTQCDRAFTTSYILKNHLLTHSGEKSFKCHICDKSFSRHTHLLVHYRSLMHKQTEEEKPQSERTMDFHTAVDGNIK